MLIHYSLDCGYCQANSTRYGLPQGICLNFDMESKFFTIESADNAINAELMAVKGRAALHHNGTIKTTYVLASTKLFVHLLIPFSVRKSMNRELNRYNCHTYRISFCETFCAAWGWPILNGAAPLHHEIPLIQDRKSLSGFHVQIVDVLAHGLWKQFIHHHPEQYGLTCPPEPCQNLDDRFIDKGL